MKAKKKTASKRLKKGKKLAATKALRTGTRSSLADRTWKRWNLILI